MRELTKDISPGKSLAGIALNEMYTDVLASLSRDYKIELGRGIVKINNGLITVGYDADGRIYSVMCDSQFRESYKGLLWAGMSVRDVLEVTDSQIAWGGCVVVNGIFGIGLPLPAGFDDFELITDFLGLDHVFENMSVFKL